MEGILSGAALKGSLALWDLKLGSPVRQYRQAPPTKKGCIGLLGESFILLASDHKLSPAGKLRKTENSKTLGWSFESEAVHSQSYIPHPISALVGTPCGQYVIAGSSEGTLVVWHAPSGRLLHLFHNIYQPISSLTINSLSDWLAVGCSDGVIHVLRVPLVVAGKPNLAEKLTFSNHSLPVTDLKFSSTTQRLYSCSLDQTVKIWSIAGNTLLCSIFFPTLLNCIALSPMEDNIYVGGSDGNVYKYNFWDLKGSDINLMDDLHKIPQIFEGKNSVNCMDVNIDGSVLVTGAEDGCIRIWSAASCQLLQVIHQEKGAIQTIRIVLKNSSMMTAGGAGFQESRLLPPLAPLSPLPYSGLSSEGAGAGAGAAAAGGVPLQITSNNLETILKTSSMELMSKDLKNETEKDLKQQIRTLRHEVTQLKQINSKWKNLNNELLGQTLTQT